jgi:hypothetical protein
MDKCQDMEYDPTYFIMHHFIGPWKCAPCLFFLQDDERLAPTHNNKRCSMCMDTLTEAEQEKHWEHEYQMDIAR